MDIEFRGNGMRENPSVGTCDEYGVSGITSFDDLTEARRNIAKAHPGFKLLISLDDLHQARYTSGHARNNLGMDDASEQDVAGLPPECFEQGEYIGYPTTKAEFAICYRNFMNLVAATSFEDACAHGLTLNEQALQEWIAYQNDPISLLEQPLSALLVPVQQSCQALAAFPNGYFTSDLDPAKNFAVARHFSETHGYELMGVGASHIGFIRSEPPDTPLANVVAKDFCALYNTSDEDRQARVCAVAQAISGRTHLWLRYVE
ncbi:MULTISPECIES: DUF4253 domain-containing protein [Pseudomonas]|uniref:DUF4253 domain-containing protein n=1 Tax=Pseudomonas TaxID=286 RepID=UPI001F5B1B59|nr:MULTISPECIES: DUF4253 domain-containing protein [Pseudomonas]